MSALPEPDWDVLEASLDSMGQRELEELGKGPIPVVPDSVTPIEAWRTWRVEDGKLTSLYSETVWTPGEALQATCEKPIEYQWEIRRHGPLTLEEARERAMRMADQPMMIMMPGSRMLPPPPRPVPSFPSVEPPDGYGYYLEHRSHDHAPEEWCECGIYAASELDGCPVGHIAGKVKLWGTVVEGERGYRAEYAYPSEFLVENHDHDVLLADFGVPIVYKDDGTLPVSSDEDLNQISGISVMLSTLDGKDPLRKHRWFLLAAAFTNLVFAVFNIVTGLGH